MSGHSKWAQIHRQKGVADAKRGALFTKLGNAITIAAREGGGNPETNFKLRLAIDQAKAGNMPKDNIERAIKRGTGELQSGQIEEVVYEGFGPRGVALVIETLTDNRNRTSSDIKHILTKHGGSLAGPNSVMWMFEKLGAIRIKEQELTDELELELIDQGATDIKREKGIIAIYCQPQNLQNLKKFLEAKEVKIELAEIELVAKNKKEITDEGLRQKLEKLFEALDASEDVSNYYTNCDI